MIDLPRVPGVVAPLAGGRRWRAWADMLLVDHGFLREIYVHRHPVAPGLWRSAQPGPRHLARARREGVRTILNLRGARADCGSYALEREACQRLGLALVDFPIRSRSALHRRTVLAALDIWAGLERPILMHCKSGADRTGFMATLYLWQIAGQPLDRAMRQLSWRFGHVRQAKTGVIDFFFESWRARHAETGIAFRQWVETEYEPRALDAQFRANRFAGLLVDRLLRRE